MAEKNHSTVKRNSVGNLTLSTIAFTDIDTGDTYDSGIPAAVAYWANATDDPTINREDVSVGYAEQVVGSDVKGRFTFFSSEDDRVVNLYVLSRT